MKLLFENTIPDNIRKVVTSLIEKNKTTNGNISLEYIPSDEVEDYDLPKKMVEQSCEIYSVSQSVCGTWDQPLGMVAVCY